MRIIHLASGDLWAGAEVQLYHLACHLSRQQDICLLVVLLNPGQLAESLRRQGVEVQILNEAALSGLTILRQFMRLAKSFKPDVIHTHRIKENVIGSLAAWRVGCKSVRTVHGASELQASGFDIRQYVFASLDRAAGRFLQHKIIAVSDELAGKLSGTYPVSKLQVIENGIDLDHVIRKSGEGLELPGDEGRFNVVFAGRFVPVKRVDIVLDIAHVVIKTCPDRPIHFYLLGDGPLWQETQTKILQHGLQDRVHLMGFVENTAAYFKKMDLLLITSDHEGLPMALLEAMALQLPVLSHELPTVKKVLCNGECGILLASNNCEKYVEKIVLLSDRPADYTAIKEKALRKVMDDYSMQKKVAHYVSLYRGLV